MRRAPTGRAEVTGTPLTDLVDGMGGWELTWASCGRGRPTELTARFLTGVGSAVARISAVGDRVRVSVALPMPEAPVNEWVSGVPKLDARGAMPGGAAPGKADRHRGDSGGDGGGVTADRRLSIAASYRDSDTVTMRTSRSHPDGYEVAALGTFSRSGTISGCPRPPRA